MRLLFDQILSPKLPLLLSDLFPSSMHVRDVGLRDADDATVWQYAIEHGYTIVSKDSDFQQRSLLFGAPPQFLWVRLGNCSVAESAELLRQHSDAIQRFGQDTSQTHLMLP